MTRGWGDLLLETLRGWLGGPPTGFWEHGQSSYAAVLHPTLQPFHAPRSPSVLRITLALALSQWAKTPSWSEV